MSPVTPSPATEPRRSARLRSKPANAEPDADPDADAELERGASRGKRQRKSAGEGTSARKRAAKDRPKEVEQPAVGAAEAPRMTEVDDAGSAINDDMCAEEPDSEEMQMGEEEEAAAAALEAEGGEGSAETLGARKKRVARPSTRRRAGASEDHFVGGPIPDGDARVRWPERYIPKDSDSQVTRRSDEEEEIGALRHYKSACVDDAKFDLGDDVFIKDSDSQVTRRSDGEEIGALCQHGSACVDDSKFDLGDGVCIKDSDSQVTWRSDGEEIGALCQYRSAFVDDAKFDLGDAVCIKSVARLSMKRKADALEDHFVGKPKPDHEARRWWTERYTNKGSNAQFKRSDGKDEKTQIFVKLCGSNSISVQENLTNLSVRRLMEVVCQKGGKKLTDSYSTLCGKPLEPEQLLSFYNVQKDSTIMVNPRLRAGMLETTNYSDWDAVIRDAVRYEVVQLPPALVDLGRNIHDATFLSPHMQNHTTRALFALCRIHYTGYCLGGQFTAANILFDADGQAHFDVRIQRLDYSDPLAKLDYVAMHAVLKPAFYGGEEIRYPLHTLDLLKFLEKPPADVHPNCEGIIAYLTNHMATLPYMLRVTMSQILCSLIARLNGADKRSLPMIGEQFNLFWNILVSPVQEMKTIYLCGAKYDQAGKQIVRYGPEVGECVRHNSNYYKHADKKFTMKELEAALSRALNRKTVMSKLLRELAVRIDDTTLHSTPGVHEFLNNVLDLLGRRTTDGVKQV